MVALSFLIPIALVLGLLGLAAFLWSLRSGQYEDLEGAAYRAVFDEDLEDDELYATPHSVEDKKEAGKKL
ncbi:cbb3-type cytochrome oxidase assembly protein CcoS [Kiloniella sp.]|uniref:cbb3-type cytochrome oxidase assembly protein CcoS n=1 Tax=Kiloniella sp. TaxID=1938587 RepID=UPI003B029DE9